MSVTLTGMIPTTVGGDTGYSPQQLLGGLIIEPPASSLYAGAVPSQVQIGPLAVLTPGTKTATTVTVAVTETVLIFGAAGGVTVTLPAAANFPGRVLLALTTTAQTLTSASSNVIAATGGAAGTAILAGTAGKWAILVSTGTAWQIVANN